MSSVERPGQDEGHSPNVWISLSCASSEASKACKLLANTARLEASRAIRDLTAGNILPYDAGFAAGSFKGFLEVLKEAALAHIADMKLAAVGSVILLEIMHKMNIEEMADNSAKMATLLSTLTDGASTSARRLLAQQREADGRVRDLLESLKRVEEWRKERGETPLQDVAVRDMADMTISEVCDAREEAINCMEKINEEHGNEFVAYSKPD
ncbi:hypothetical protein DOTSEDRAFT_56299 [Dothistroma septosporum NZE10]|uniref:Uncharacterized protein n=1 Tax=Dothistroma septosporum (strain NZE10 / CBS 128990) TaxID=675120 RepID=N1PCH0_DOTSN|nr:hypothetical protein DOTSEDRAFT_56299 [Dothistroma septosporum NZE10]